MVLLGRGASQRGAFFFLIYGCNTGRQAWRTSFALSLGFLAEGVGSAEEACGGERFGGLGWSGCLHD